MKLLWASLLWFGLAGCAVDRKNQQTAPISAGLASNMAVDAIKQLQILYPPGQTRFNISQPIAQTDAFGTTLIKAMREKGYAVQVFSPEKAVGTPARLNVQYMLDKPEIRLYEGLYRVTLSVGKSLLTRAYTDSNQSAIPAGAWAVME